MSAYYRTTDGAVLDLSAEQLASLAASKRDTLRPYSVDVKPVPTATERVDAGPVVVTALAARKTWVLVALTPSELALIQLRQQRDADLIQIRAAYAALKNGTGTAGERMTRCERILARLLLDIFGSEPT